MSKEITKYLTIKLDKETKEPIGFLWQGNIKDISKEKVLGCIKDWNDAAEKGKVGFLYTLCEDEYIKSLLSDFQENPKDRSVNVLACAIDEVQNTIDDIESTLDEIKNELKRLKPIEEEENE